MTNPPPIRRVPPPPLNPREVRVSPQLDHPPLTLRPPPERDRVYERRVEAERLCLWMPCRRKLCRAARHCVGTYATCVFENPDIVDPIL